jgi:hypothetical protein
MSRLHLGTRAAGNHRPDFLQHIGVVHVRGESESPDLAPATIKRAQHKVPHIGGIMYPHFRAD